MLQYLTYRDSPVSAVSISAVPGLVRFTNRTKRAHSPIQCGFSRNFGLYFQFFQKQFQFFQTFQKILPIFVASYLFCLQIKSILLFLFLNLVNLVCIKYQSKKECHLERLLYLLVRSTYVCKQNPQKVDFENPKVQNRLFSTKTVFNYCGFSNSAVCWGPKNRTNRGIPVSHNDFKTLFLKWCHFQKCQSNFSLAVQFL